MTNTFRYENRVKLFKNMNYDKLENEYNEWRENTEGQLNNVEKQFSICASNGSSLPAIAVFFTQKVYQDE